MDIQIKENVLVLNGNEIKFDHKIRQFKAAGRNVIVLTAIPGNDNSLDNIYSVNEDGTIRWQVQSIKEAMPELKNAYPFEQMTVIDSQISASDFFGRRFFINLSDGKITGKDTVK